MVIDFDKMETHDIPEFRGGTGVMHLRRAAYDDGNAIMRIVLDPGSSVGLHTHDNDCEIIYILSGEGHVEYDGEILPIHAGQAHYCPKGHSHRVINDSNDELVFFATVPTQA